MHFVIKAPSGSARSLPLSSMRGDEPSQLMISARGQLPSDFIETNRQRFVAGEQFYNDALFGSLRRGACVSWSSKQGLGLIAAIFSSLFSYLTLKSVLKPLLSSHFAMTSREIIAYTRLIELPMALSVFVGLISDCHPIFGTRRKAYMVLGLVLNGLSILALVALSTAHDARENEHNSALNVLAILLAGLASAGCITTYIAIQTRVIEISQCEPFRTRGRFQAGYLVARRLTSLTEAGFTLLVLGSSDTFTRLSAPVTMLIMVALSILPLPLILLFWPEDAVQSSVAQPLGVVPEGDVLPPPPAPKVSLKARGLLFWRVMQQKAVWRTLLFICVFTLFLAIEFSDSLAVIRKWSGIKSENAIYVRSVQDGVMLLSNLAWTYFFLRRSWPMFFALAPLFMIVPMLLLSLLVSMDVVRDPAFYRTLVSISYLGDGVNQFTNLVPLTEIIQEGTEGVTVGLTLSLQRLIAVFVSTNANGLFRGNNFYDPDELTSDPSTTESHARLGVLLSLLLNFALNALACIGLYFLPHQKLDAQQMRMYGGFTKAASTTIVAIAALFFLYSLAINIISMVPGWSCLVLAGGAGC